ncbi:MAG: FdtA/QdtA family cupin domain-containing protein [Muribaculaceae bacterium]|nr:FdtA/QdtA family cupin domain-containing protein [Muribaculaceae bacterium]
MTYDSILDKVRVLEFPKICDPRGNLSFVEGDRHVPFPIRRIFYIYDVPGGETRGGHAHKECLETLIAITGAFDVKLTDGKNEMVIRLDRANKGVLIPSGVWRVLDNFTTGAVALSLASDIYKEDDYIRDFDEFCKYSVR